MFRNRCGVVGCLTIWLIGGAWGLTAEPAADPYLAWKGALDALMQPLQANPAGPWTISLKISRDGQAWLAAQVVAAAEDQFALGLESGFLTLQAGRDPQRAYLALPEKKLLFLGAGGETPAGSRLTATELLARTRRLAPTVANYLNLLAGMDGETSLAMLMMAGVKLTPATSAEGLTVYEIGGKKGEKLRVLIDPAGPRLTALEIGLGGRRYRLEPKVEPTAQPPALPAGADLKTVAVNRTELETALLKGLVRAGEIQYDGRLAPRLADGVRRGPHGVYVRQGGHRVVVLRGTPEEIGRQHGEFLAVEARKLVESTLYVVGTLYSCQRGRWFLDEIRAAADRLEPHVPPAQLAEGRALAQAAGIDYAEFRLAQIFPELFHCSGFAIAGPATVGGRLYHGRVLDYMTEIGLQDNAAVLVVAPTGKIPFVNIGYGGLVGSVTGMNAQQVALGEMGGQGEGKWDGTPMTALMRLALEEAHNLAEAKTIFQQRPRTCEYYYVFSCGQDRSAAGVGATPEGIFFLAPGEAHPRLPEAVPGCVLLSAGERYKLLVDRVKKQQGRIDAPAAMRLMDGPVAMSSNLHNALFAPETLELWVADAGPQGPAWREEYRHYSLPEMLAWLKRAPGETAPAKP